MALRRIIAVCVVRNGATVLQQTLDAIAAQSTPVDLTVVVDLSSSDSSGSIMQGAQPELGFQLPSDSQFRDAVLAALERVSDTDRQHLGEAGANEMAGDDWLWLLSQDNTPDVDALRALIHEAEISPSVGVIGPKLVRPDDPSRLVEFGQTLTASGATVHLAAGDLDQGQFAKQSDVLGVAASGMLVKRSVWEELDGFDPALPNVDTGLDFSIRARLTGHRVIVSPDARVAYDRELNLFSTSGNPLTAIRRAQLHRRLSYSNILLLPFPWLLMLPEAILRAIYVLLNKQPRRFFPELFGALAAMFSFGSIAKSRSRFKKTQQHSLSSLSPLRRSVAESRRVSAHGRENFREQRQSGQEATQFMFGGGALSILILLGVGIVAYGSFWGGNHLFGGGASPLGTLEELWRNALWHADVLNNPSDPFAIVLALLGTLTFWNPSFSLVLLYVLALPLAGLGAWLFVARLGNGKFGSSQLIRASAAIIWAVSPMF
ncbi:MAG: glycosyltransferase, partial [Microbacteriaceae bacterium]